MNHSVKLIAVTKPTGEDSNDTAEELIAYMARVSNPTNQDNKLTASKLLKYLVKNNHWSPFEMVHMVMEIQCTRTIGRQILRHRSFSFQEFSQRYAEVNKDMFTKVEARLQDPKNRQNSVDIKDPLLDWDGTPIVDKWDSYQQQTITDAVARYKWAIGNGVAKEQARAILPEGLTMSRMYMAGSLRSWIHYCMLRMSNGTQKEHQVIAIDCWSIICQEFPSLRDLFT